MGSHDLDIQRFACCKCFSYEGFKQTLRVLLAFNPTLSASLWMWGLVSTTKYSWPCRWRMFAHGPPYIFSELKVLERKEKRKKNQNSYGVWFQHTESNWPNLIIDHLYGIHWEDETYVCTKQIRLWWHITHDLHFSISTALK